MRRQKLRISREHLHRGLMPRFQDKAFAMLALACLLLSACAQSEPASEPSIEVTRAPLTADKQSAAFQLPAGATPLRLVVKFNEGSDVRLQGGRPVTVRQGALPASAGAANTQALTAELDRVDAELRRRGLRLSRLFNAADEQLVDLKRRGEARSRRALADLALYHSIPASAFASTAAMEELRAYLAGLPFVEVAYIEAEPPPPPDANTPDLRPRQRYKGPAPVGVDADFSATVPGGKGAGVRVVDVENRLVQPHEDLPPVAYARGVAQGDATNQHHVVSVTGVIAGRENSYGVTGIAPEVAFGTSGSSSENGYNIPEAIIAPIVSGFLREGDVLLLELQRTGPTPSNCRCTGGTSCFAYVPEEFMVASYDAIATATANGVVVVEAAGNGYVNLDDTVYQRAFDRTVRDSGAIMVGARSSIVEQPMCFSNAGRRIDVHAWGESVTTTGSGDAYQGALGYNDMYTNVFSGTSSASAITAGVVASLQGFARARFGVPLSPAELRDVLKATGTPQTAELESPIGVQPNLRAAIARLSGDAQPTQTTWVENFDTGLQHLTVATTGVDLPWTRYSGATPTTSTGPAGDRTTGSGYYMYIESSGSGVGYPNKTAILQTACLDLRGASAASLTFYYHMVGVEMGRLIAEADTGCDGGTPVKLFEQIGARTGSERNGFVRQSIDLTQLLGSTVQLRLRGITGSGPRSDMAVDDVSVSITRRVECTSDAQCSAPQTCFNQRCVSCRTDAECANGYCADGRCGECRFDADCSDDGIFCTEEVCGEANVCLRRARSCGGRVCSNELQRCVGCRTTADCPTGNVCGADNQCTPSNPCVAFTSTTQQHIDASRAYTVRTSTRVEGRVNGSNELLESRSLYGRFSTTLRTVRTRATLPGYELGGCPR